MFKEKIFMLCFTMLMFTCCLGLSLPANADDGCGGSTAPSLPANVERTDDYCSSKTKIIWNDANSTDNLARNSSRILTIADESGMGGPYTWSVSGIGFYLATTDPTGTSNTLYANGTACGSATITVRGCGGKEVIGYVRCTSGQWVTIQSQGASCPWSGVRTPDSVTQVGNYLYADKIDGKWNVHTTFFACRSFGGFDALCVDDADIESLQQDRDTFVAGGSCCGNYCNECLSIPQGYFGGTYFNYSNGWPSWKSRATSDPIASSGLTPTIYIECTYPGCCSSFNPYKAYYATLAFYNAKHTVQEWQCP